MTWWIIGGATMAAAAALVLVMSGAKISANVPDDRLDEDERRGW